MIRTLLATTLVLLSGVAHAADTYSEGGEEGGLLSGSWSVTLGASGYFAPGYEGADKMVFRAVPLVSVGRTGTVTKFSSRNDNISIGLIDNGTFRAGLAGKILFGRDDDDSDDLKGLDPVRWGGELGIFAEVYPTDWMRIRGELRHGIRTHDAFVGDLAADVFYDVTPTIRLSAGPRASFASENYFDTYYGVNAAESAASGLSVFDPNDGGLKSYGFGGAVTWQATDKITTSLFGEYARLEGEAADSSLVKERGSVDQFTIGLSATYRFDFTF
ncbi:MAG: MipA/OmpV family protein [Rhizobiaceae bacterium]|nr:MipA/OmpV family protein [Rhizobiaceae bacterium]